MLAPILVIEKETLEVMFFPSLAAAQGYIEPYDVQIYELYAADGQVIDVHLDNKPKSFWSLSPGDVRLEPTDRFDPERIRGALCTYLQRIRNFQLDESASLESLVHLLTDTQPSG